MRLNNMKNSSDVNTIKKILTPRRITTWLGLLVIAGAATIGLMETKEKILDKAKTYDWIKVEGEIDKIENLGKNGRSKIHYIYSFEGATYIGNSIDASRYNSISLNNRERRKFLDS